MTKTIEVNERQVSDASYQQKKKKREEEEKEEEKRDRKRKEILVHSLDHNRCLEGHVSKKK